MRKAVLVSALAAMLFAFFAPAVHAADWDDVLGGVLNAATGGWGAGYGPYMGGYGGYYPGYFGGYGGYGGYGLGGYAYPGWSGYYGSGDWF